MKLLKLYRRYKQDKQLLNSKYHRPDGTIIQSRKHEYIYARARRRYKKQLFAKALKDDFLEMLLYLALSPYILLKAVVRCARIVIEFIDDRI